jgi:phosphoenolpyruvate carboxylase
VDRDATSAQVRLLGDLLGRTIADIEGQDRFALVERVRALAVAHRRGDTAAGPELTKLLADVPVDEALVLVSAFANWFQLINLAEDQAMVRQLAVDRVAAGERGESHTETIRAAIETLAAWGLSAEAAAAAIGEVAIRPVLTAHPTEAKRRTVLTKLDRVARALGELDGERAHAGASGPPRALPRRGDRVAVADRRDPCPAPIGDRRGAQRALLDRRRPVRSRPAPAPRPA